MTRGKYRRGRPPTSKGFCSSCGRQGQLRDFVCKTCRKATRPAGPEDLTGPSEATTI